MNTFLEKLKTCVMLDVSDIDRYAIALESTLLTRGPVRRMRPPRPTQHNATYPAICVHYNMAARFLGLQYLLQSNGIPSAGEQNYNEDN